MALQTLLVQGDSQVRPRIESLSQFINGGSDVLVKSLGGKRDIDTLMF